jgi:hypothetical protein
MLVEPGAACLRTTKDSMLARCELIDLLRITNALNMPISLPGFNPLVDRAPGLGNHDLLL